MAASRIRSPRPKRLGTLAVCTVIAVLGATAPARAADPADVTATLETPAVFDDAAGGNANADDPAIWYNTKAPERSLVITAVKEAGLRVYRLDGTQVQALPAGGESGGAPGRLNNVDIVTDLRIGGQTGDVVLASDRGSDHVRIYRIRPDHPNAPLAEITDPSAPPVFAADQSDVDGDTTAYGLTAWQDSKSGKSYALVTRAGRDTIGLVELRPTASGTVTYRTVRTLRLPDTFTLPDGKQWTPCEDPGEQPQAEGLVVDPANGTLYAAQEDVGVWRLPADLQDSGKLIDKVREFGVPAHYDAATDDCVVDGPDPGAGGEHLSADVEGLTLSDDRLIASSQGDDTFALYDRAAPNQYRTSFRVGDGQVDGSQSCDGLGVLDRPLGPSFPHGLLVVQDGEDTPIQTGPDGKPRESTNLKFVDWSKVPH